MSGDNGPAPAVIGAVNCLSHYAHLSITLVGQEPLLTSCLKDYALKHDRLCVMHAPEVVGMSDRPSQVLRSKATTSMAVALQLLRDNHDACVCAGNTGALMLLSRSILKTHPEIDRPAIIKRLPSPFNACYVVDLGANVDCRAEHLYQFALMGVAMVEAMEDRVNPTVALLNVGEEETKGNEQVRLASRMLSDSRSINYVGFVEGDALFRTAVDVIVCDGFVGNVALKTGEGVGHMMADLLRQQFSAGFYGHMVGLLARPLLKTVFSALDSSRHNGASLVGLTKTVVKCHGNSQVAGFESAISQAMEEASREVPKKVYARLDELL
jgi:glycerol-3-phosphate acyltransferase PlsX